MDQIRMFTNKQLTDRVYELNNIFCSTLNEAILVEMKYIVEEIQFRQLNCTNNGYIDIEVFV